MSTGTVTVPAYFDDGIARSASQACPALPDRLDSYRQTRAPKARCHLRGWITELSATGEIPACRILNDIRKLRTPSGCRHYLVELLAGHQFNPCWFARPLLTADATNPAEAGNAATSGGLS